MMHQIAAAGVLALGACLSAFAIMGLVGWLPGVSTPSSTTPAPIAGHVRTCWGHADGSIECGWLKWPIHEGDRVETTP
jgi:hypothetical protein